MADNIKGDRVILTIGAIGRGKMSEPATIRKFQDHIALEEALEPFRRKAREKAAEKGDAGGRPSFADALAQKKNT